ncbi:MAG: sulfatase, partial [Oscillospiraceae bacterium]|nr:sulfatase [Oscillospiraceae bacterium]
FDRHYCADAPCLPSRAGLISGRFGIRTGAVGHGGTAADMRVTGPSRQFRDAADEGNLINVFRKAGLRTASVSTFAERHSSYWFNAGFNETLNVGGRGMESGEAVLPPAIEWLDRNGRSDGWFLHVHLWDPHTPYRAPADFGDPFADAPLGTWITEETLSRHLTLAGPHTASELGMYGDSEDPAYPRHPGKVADMAGLRRLIDGYDTGILYADYLIGKILDRLGALRVLDDTAIIVTSDHGESMGELGIYAEHATADAATCAIPLIIKWPGCKAGHADGGIHCNLDLAPTMAGLLGVAPNPDWDGMSMAETVTEGKPSGRESLVISQLAHTCQRSALFGDWLYMRTYHDGHHLFDGEMLYDLAADPHEENDVKDAYRGVCDMGARIILDWQDSMLSRRGAGTDPLWTVMSEGGPYHAPKSALPGYLERLRATGRPDKAALLAERHGSPGLGRPAGPRDPGDG